MSMSLSYQNVSFAPYGIISPYLPPASTVENAPLHSIVHPIDSKGQSPDYAVLAFDLTAEKGLKIFNGNEEPVTFLGKMFFKPADFFKDILSKRGFSTFFSCQETMNKNTLPKNIKRSKRIDCHHMKPKDQASCVLLQPHGQFFDYLAKTLCAGEPFESLLFEMNLIKKAIPRSEGVKRTLLYEFPWYAESLLKVQFPPDLADERIRDFVRNHPKVSVVNAVDHLPLSVSLIKNLVGIFGKYSTEAVKISVTLDCLIYRKMYQEDPLSIKNFYYLMNDPEFLNFFSEFKTTEYINFLEEAACQKGLFEQIKFVITVVQKNQHVENK